MEARWDTVQVEGDPMRVYLSLPDGPGPHPGVVVAHHIGGPDDFTRATADWLAQAGYVAAVPDFFHRHPDANMEELDRLDHNDPERMVKIREMSGRMKDPLIVVDANATVEYLRQLPEIQVGPVGVTGCCMGGRITYLLASQAPVFQAAAVFYGGNVLVARGAERSPFELTAEIGCPLIGFFGDDDKNPSPENVQMLREELTKHGKSFEFHSYAGAGHGFLSSVSSPGYRKGPADDSWARMLGFFGKHLRAGVGASAGT